MVMVGQNVISGTPEGLFQPEKSVTRAEFVKMAAEAFRYKATGAMSVFTDVSDYSWYYEDAAALYGNGVVEGFGDGKLGPDERMARGQMAVIIYRIMLDQGITTDTARNYTPFAGYAYKAIQALYERGIINGTGDNNCLPKSYATEAQVAAILHRVTED